MPQFAFTAKDRLGNTIQGKVASDSMMQATGQVEQMGYMVLSVQALPETAGAPPSAQQPPSVAYGQNPTAPPFPSASPYPSSPSMPPRSAQDPTRVMQAPAAPQPPIQEPTRGMPPAPASPDVLADAEKRRKVEADLKRLGMSPEEIRRLLNADAATYDAPNIQPTPPTAIPLPVTAAAKPKKVRNEAAASLQNFAAELMTANAAKNKQEVQSVNLELPPFRESSMQEKMQSEALLREASTLRRREKYRDAEVKCREALSLTPSDAAALELLGDLMQGVARTPEALAAYKRATEAAPKRASAEKKYADLLSRQQNWGNYDPEEPPRSTWISMMMSALFPGAGQLYCAQYAKGIFFLLATALCTYLLAWSPFGFQGEHRHGGINTSLIVSVGFSVVLYVICLADARTSAQNYGKRGGESGWEV